MFVNYEWLRKWPNQTLKGLRRSYSDHVPLLLQNGIKDWGPRPFRFMNSWIEQPQFKEFFQEKWQSYHIEGWAAFRLKEKMKLLKRDLRGWNKEIFGNIDFNIDKKEEIEVLDRIDDAMGLEEAEIIQVVQFESFFNQFLSFVLKITGNASMRTARTKLFGGSGENSNFYPL
ncbi:hypothetical protein ACS0TY_028897 [Phlomoides rotata]